MIQERKNIKNYSQMMYAYQKSCSKIHKRYTHQMMQITSDSIKVLYDLFQQYLSHKKIKSQGCQNTQMNSTQQSSTIKQGLAVSNGYKEDDCYCITNVKKHKLEQNKENENLLLSKQLKKLNLGPDYLLIQDQSEQDQPTSKIKNFQQIKDKNLFQLILDSEKKIKEKQNQQLKQTQQFEDEQDSQYILTDYSSNQSSNDGSYSPYFAQQTENKPLFGKLFTKTISTQSMSNISNSSSNLLNFNFSSKQLLKSPKKQQKNKRLFIGKQTIPRWAEDLEQIQKKCTTNQQMEGTTIFGKCLVQNLNTNIIFHIDQSIINRSSSAKWNKNIFLH